MVYKKPKINCDTLHGGEAFYTTQDDVFKYNWWEVFCFPYILCARLWDCCMSLCSGANQCLLYWMAIQWIICKITRLTTPDPILFPYFFYLFCQVILLTLFFILIWLWLGKKVFIPYFQAFYLSLSNDNNIEDLNNLTSRRMAFRKYCFKKSELFDQVPPSDASFMTSRADLGIATALLEMYYLYWEYY